MGVEVKICGITSVAAADAALKAGADYAGLMFHERSPRRLGPHHAGIIAERIRGRVRLVAVVADADDETLAGIVTVVKPDFLQFHGQEGPARVDAVRRRFGIAVIKVFSVAEAVDFAAVPAFADVADRLLFDAKAPPSADRPGGHGAAFDWQLLRGRSFSRPWFLAGGLHPGNVARAIAMSGAPAVDVSSGVETAPGEKDPELVRAFTEAARNAQFVPEPQA